MSREVIMKRFDPDNLPEDFSLLFENEIQVVYCGFPYTIKTNNSQILENVISIFPKDYSVVLSENLIFVYFESKRNRTYLLSFQSCLYAEIIYPINCISHYIVELMQVDLIQDTKNYFCVNGTVLLYNNDLIVLFAPANNGKTTLAIDFLRKGAQLISDVSFLYNATKNVVYSQKSPIITRQLLPNNFTEYHLTGSYCIEGIKYYIYECYNGYISEGQILMDFDHTFCVFINKSNEFSNLVSLLKYRYIDMDVLVNVAKFYENIKHHVVTIQGYKSAHEVLKRISTIKRI